MGPEISWVELEIYTTGCDVEHGRRGALVLQTVLLWLIASTFIYGGNTPSTSHVVSVKVMLILVLVCSF